LASLALVALTTAAKDGNTINISKAARRLGLATALIACTLVAAEAMANQNIPGVGYSVKNPKKVELVLR
jgi:hypothetical protein